MSPSSGVRARPSFARSRWLFMRTLALVYLAAFLSMAPQIAGLVGSRGIEPARAYLHSVGEAVGAAGWWYVPTVFWLGAGDGALSFACWTGALLALLLLFDLAPGWLCAALYVLYLSVVSVGGTFLSFQWDVLLLEAGLLAIAYAPWRLRPGARQDGEPSVLARWLLWWLVFRLMFESGAVKLTSGDPVWRDLSALEFHYWTQPLPNPLAWYAHGLPAWFQQASVALMFAIELGAPFLVLAPRGLRHAGALSLVGLQVLILLTGNYGFFNLLSIALCLTLLDDRALLGRRAEPRGSEPRAKSVLLAPLALVALVTGGIQLANLAGDALDRPPLGSALLQRVAPLRSFNSYGLFRVMTRGRPEISVQGSNDGREWLDYPFRWKPGDVQRAPPQVAPHMPRLDWQMWFAALGSPRTSPWFGALLRRLLEGSPEVLELLERDPFAGTPPRYVRAVLYRYRFATPAERRETGAWWSREEVALYHPPVSL